MSESPGNNQFPEQEPEPRWSRSNIILVIIAGILVILVLACGIGSYFARRGGEPVQAAAFMDEETSGLAMFRSDMEDPAYRQLLSVIGAAAIKYNISPKYNELFKFFKENKQEDVPSSSIVGSFKNNTPADLQRFVVLSFRQLPKFYRWQAGSAYENIANKYNAPRYDDARILPAKEFFAEVRQNTANSEGGEESQPVVPPKALENKEIALYDDCLFIGTSVADVEAGLKAFKTQPAENAEPVPFMNIFDHVDTDSMLFGAASNENGILLAALFPNEEKREEIRNQIQGMLVFEPEQIQNLAVSLEVATIGVKEEQTSDNPKLKGVIKLWLDAASPEAAQQVKATVESLVKSQTQTTQEFPLEFSIVEDETSLNENEYQTVVEVVGIEEYVDQLIAAQAKKWQAEKPKQLESETPEAPAPDQPENSEGPVKVNQP